MSISRVLYPEFLDFMIESGALLFGDFTLKSGRKSPYFINTGEYKTGAQLNRLGDFYAKLIENSVRSENCAGSVDEQVSGEARAELNERIASRFNVLFGPAYKGIPLVTAAAARLARNGLTLNVSFNRKERKGHGEDGLIMGYQPRQGDRIAIIEDVTTAGTSVREIHSLLHELGGGAKITALYISVDRQERGTGAITAIEQLKRDFGIEVYSIATVSDIVEYLDTQGGRTGIPEAGIYAGRIREYLSEYGARE